MWLFDSKCLAPPVLTRLPIAERHTKSHNRRYRQSAAANFLHRQDSFLSTEGAYPDSSFEIKSQH